MNEYKNRILTEFEGRDDAGQGGAGVWGGRSVCLVYLNRKMLCRTLEAIL